MSENEEIVRLGSASSEVEAGMWNQILKQAGVVALVRPGGPGAGAWASSASFEHQVYVRADQLALAQQVLEGALEGGRPLPRARTSAPRVNRVRVQKDT